MSNSILPAGAAGNSPRKMWAIQPCGRRPGDLTGMVVPGENLDAAIATARSLGLPRGTGSVSQFVGVAK